MNSLFVVIFLVFWKMNFRTFRPEKQAQFLTVTSWLQPCPGLVRLQKLVTTWDPEKMVLHMSEFTCPSCEKSEKAKYERPATVTSNPWHQSIFLGRLGGHLVVDHGPGALVVPLVDCLVGIHQLHLHLLHHSSTKAAVNSTVPAPLRLVKSPFADNILESDEGNRIHLEWAICWGVCLTADNKEKDGDKHPHSNCRLMRTKIKTGWSQLLVV